MFAASKILWDIVDPETILAVTLLVGAGLLWTRWRRVGRALATGAILVLCLISIFPVGHWLYHALENRFPPLAVVPADIDGIMVLGGSFNLNRTAARDQVALKDSADRLTTFVTLARRHGDARLLFSGGSASLRPGSLLTEAADAKRLFTELGLDTARIEFEDRSRNTYENALFAYQLAEPAVGERWLLITSASHMPRAVGCFRRVGWEVIAYPVDYKTAKDLTYLGDLNIGKNLATLSRAAHEWVGLIAYYLMGRTTTIFPAPVTEPGTEGAAALRQS
jgi:uncharacterized SAM-binding protein YcdF (DUF218 family)